jgi:hypothetical protein
MRPSQPSGGRTVFCLTLKQPWATLLVLGEKTFETRSWETRHRGPLGITSSKDFPHALKMLCRQEPFAALLSKHGLTADDLPLGCLVGVVNIEDCLHTEDLVGSQAPGDPERFLGDFTPGRFAWLCTNPVRLVTPVPVRGKRCIFEIDNALLTPVDPVRASLRAGRIDTSLEVTP